MRRLVAGLLLVGVAALALGASGCGGGSDDTPDDPVSAVRSALENEGIEVTTASKGKADDMLLADGVRVGFFATPAKAQDVGGPLESFLATGDQGEAKVTGNVVFLMTVTSGMTSEDRETFDKVVSTSEVALDEVDESQ